MKTILVLVLLLTLSSCSTQSRRAVGMTMQGAGSGLKNTQYNKTGNCTVSPNGGFGNYWANCY